MRITDFLYHKDNNYNLLLDECSQFIEESHGSMLFRALPKGYSDLHKVKVRKKKSGDVDHIFNEAFDEQHPQLRQRAILACGTLPTANESTEPFFVFPIDGYKFMYNTKVADSGDIHQQMLNNVTESIPSETGLELVADILKFTYTFKNIHEGINSGAEIVLYNTPYYYAVRVNDTSIQALSSMNIL